MFFTLHINNKTKKVDDVRLNASPEEENKLNSFMQSGLFEITHPGIIDHDLSETGFYDDLNTYSDSKDFDRSSYLDFLCALCTPFDDYESMNIFKFTTNLAREYINQCILIRELRDKINSIRIDEPICEDDIQDFDSGNFDV